ncbi:MAG TPA: VWA domain-containing protein [Thermoanaerobaculia bacterium]|nr:VWA domain-containing protein [Thermoanaerobaculia bacterium]
MLAALLFALQQPQMQEQITVERVIVDARVTDAEGNPITGLKPSDFKVKIDGKTAKVEAADWIADTAAQREIDETMAEAPAPATAPEPQRGRLLVFLYQTDFARNSVRVRGQMKLLSMNEEWLDWLEPEDRVAVLSFDSHLKFRLDFTNRKSDIANAMEEALYISDPPWPQKVPLPSLGSRLKPEVLKDIASPERALIEIGNALLNIPGPKSLILFGWGLGRFSREGVHMAPNYWIARQALEMARVSVFSIDFTEADFHSLAAGLEKVAGDTGGFYASTHNFPHLALKRLKRTLAGHYELEVRKPETKTRGTHVIEVDVAKRGAYVLARSTYVDK